ncbi:MAG: nucleotidyltransferase [Oscillospiraceae bacterium]|nr:nucleotidyltransferase [Oscillospiraceae bacterium]
MKAVIMAGGEGSRLRPLTCNIPKPLAPLCGKPVLEYILDLLNNHGCDEAVVTLMYLGNKIVNHFDSEPYKNIELGFAFEETPLGTAGSVKAAAKKITEDFIVISGDAMCDFDLTKAFEFHKKNKAMATLIVKQVSDPREYGLVNVDQDGKIAGFLEKPSLAHCITNLANTGIYILSPQVLDFIKENEVVDFAKDVFPKMLEQEAPLFAFTDDGYWCDIGDLKSYVRCQKDMLEQKVNCEIAAYYEDGIYSCDKNNLNNPSIKAPAYIGKNVRIGEGCAIEEGSIIGDDVTIGDHSVVHGSVILNACFLNDKVCCEDAIIGHNAKLMHGCTVGEQAVVGDDSIIGKNAIISSGVRVWNNKTVPEAITLTEDLRYGIAKEINFDEDGISGETNIGISPALCTKIGGAVGGIKKNNVVGIGASKTNSGRALKHAVISGILSAGATVWDFGDCIQTEFDFCVNKSMVDFGVYIDAGLSTDIKLVEKGGLPVVRSLERKLEGAINRDEHKRASWKEVGECVDVSSLRQMYQIELLKSARISLEGMEVGIKCANVKIKSIMQSVLGKLGCVDSEDFYIQISTNGKNVSAFKNEYGHIYPEQILSVVCLGEFLHNKDVSIPYSAPKTIDAIAQKYNRTVFRYYDCPCDDSDKEARKTAVKQPFFKDGLMMAIKFLSYLKETKLSIEQVMEQIPEFHTSNRLISVSINPSVIIKKLNKQKGKIGEGITIKHQDGDVVLRPLKSGRGIMLFAESRKGETANELCDFFEKVIKQTDLDTDNK